VRLAAGADLMSLAQLDQKLWVALSCPTPGLEFDGKTLELLDADGDGRIRVPEIIDAVRWVGAVLKNPDDLIKGSAYCPLLPSTISQPRESKLLDSAKQSPEESGQSRCGGDHP